jgi:type III restriction enzyme
VVVVDESHNAESQLSVEMMKNLNPDFILDLTATPRNNSNIISFVDALALKKQHMVKLPVIVANRSSKGEVIESALILRRQLEDLAKQEEAAGGKHIRPIVLFQAQPRTDDDNTTFEKIREKLVELKIPADQIKIKTADINELKGVDLMSRDCPVRFIITVNALKEGWDCPFAYILASLADKTSAVDVEQILGRVLRMPHVQQHGNDLLNLSYVFTASNRFMDTLQSVVKGLNRAGFSDKDYRAIDAQATGAATPAGSQLALNSCPWRFVCRNQMAADDQAPCRRPGRKRRIARLGSGRHGAHHQPRILGADAREPTAATPRRCIRRRCLRGRHQGPCTGRKPSFRAEGAGQQRRRSTGVGRQDEPTQGQRHLPRRSAGVTPAAVLHPGAERRLLRGRAAVSVVRARGTAEGIPPVAGGRNISFEDVETEVYRVDLEQLGDENYAPRAFKLAARERVKFTNYLLALSRESQVMNLVSRLAELVGNMYPITDPEVKEYIRRVVTGMNAEQIRDCIERDVAYVRKIKQKITTLANVHALKTFTDMLDVDRIAMQPSFVPYPSRSLRAPMHRLYRRAFMSPRPQWVTSSDV